MYYNSIKKLIIITVILLSMQSFANIISLKGNQSFINVKSQINYKITVKKPLKDFKFRMFKIQTYTNGINKQIIYNRKYKIKPKPDKITENKDILGNNYIDFFYKKLSKNITINYKTQLDTELSLFYINSLYNKYNHKEKIIKSNEIFLKETKQTKISNKKLIKIIKKIKESSKTQIEIILKIFNWVKSNITYKEEVKYKSANKTFSMKQGNYHGILNLLLSILRKSNIACKITHGFIAKKKINLKLLIKTNSVLFKDTNKLEIRYPKSISQWIEIYFPNIGWIPFSPFILYSFLPSNFIKHYSSLDISNNNLAISENQKIKTQINFFNEGKEKDNIVVKKNQTKKNMQIILPNINQKVISIINKELKSQKEKKPEYKKIKKNIKINFTPLSMQFKSSKNILDLKVSPDFFYSQKLNIPQDIILTEISLPLFFFKTSIKNNIEIWLEIYKDNANIKQNVIKSKKVNIKKLNTENQYKWIKFNFQKKLKKGNHWIILKHKNEEIILWRATFANKIFQEYDSIYLNKSLKPLSYLYLDLNIKLKGKLL